SRFRYKIIPFSKRIPRESISFGFQGHYTTSPAGSHIVETRKAMGSSLSFVVPRGKTFGVLTVAPSQWALKSPRRPSGAVVSSPEASHFIRAVPCRGMATAFDVHNVRTLVTDD